MVTKIWFTAGLSSTSDAIRGIRADPAAQDLWVMASHTDAGNPVREDADAFVHEPSDLDDAAHAAWVLETGLRHDVALIVVQRRQAAVWVARAGFAARGIRLQIAARPEMRDLLDDKLAFQADIAAPDVAETGVVGHAARPFRTLAEFDMAWAAMTVGAAPGHVLCAKPARSIFGAGFRRIEPGADDMARMLSTDPQAGFRISLEAYRQALGRAVAPVQQLLMPYLPGPERSVDFVAHHGQLQCAVVRVKLGKVQRLETAGPAVEMTRVLATRYGLDGMCNLQTRENEQGCQAVLEINPRMSGGMAMACLAGVNLPLMAVLAGLDRDLSGLGTPIAGRLVRSRSVAQIVDA